MEWSSDIMLQLINAYRDRPVLWDPAHRFYRLSSRKNEAWVELAVMFNSDVLQVKRKINSLLASFRRERHKVRLGEAGHLNGQKKYRSSWFAFESFTFLYDKWKNESGGQNVANALLQPDDQDNFIQVTDILANDQDLIKVEKSDLVNENEDEEEEEEEEHLEDITTNQTPVQKPYRPVKPIRTASKPRFRTKATHDDSSLLKALKMLQKVSPKQRDECDVYGEYIASKLRKLDERTRCIVQHEINNILFDADMGKYNNAQYVYTSATGFTSQDGQSCTTEFQQNPFPSPPTQQL